jgi:hypothetical protein
MGHHSNYYFRNLQSGLSRDVLDGTKQECLTNATNLCCCYSGRVLSMDFPPKNLLVNLEEIETAVAERAELRLEGPCRSTLDLEPAL